VGRIDSGLLTHDDDSDNTEADPEETKAPQRGGLKS